MILRARCPSVAFFPFLMMLLARPCLLPCRPRVCTGVAAVAIHGSKDQSEREAAIQGFKQGTKDVLVATDVASKGLDFPDIQHVINYDMPKSARYPTSPGLFHPSFPPPYPCCTSRVNLPPGSLPSSPHPSQSTGTRATRSTTAVRVARQSNDLTTIGEGVGVHNSVLGGQD